MKKKLAIIIPAIIAGVVVIAITVVVFVYAIPLLKLSKNMKNIDNQTDSSYSTEEAGSVQEETYTDENGEVHTKPSEETLTAETSSSGSTTGDDTTATTDKGSSDTTKKPSQNNTSKDPSTTQATSATTTSSAGTTKPSDTTSAPNTTKPSVPSTTVPVTTAPQNTKSEYDVYRSGHFYAKGTAVDGDGVATPLELAVTDKTVYMISQIDGVNIGILVDGKKTYMMYSDKKKYCELSTLLMNAADLNPDEMVATAKESYAELQPLDKAVRLAEGVVNGVNCKTYHFKNEAHELTTVSISGSKLVQVSKYDANGRIETTINFTSVSADVPSDKMSPPKDYKKTNMISFLMELSKAMGVELE